MIHYSISTAAVQSRALLRPTERGREEQIQVWGRTGEIVGIEFSYRDGVTDWRRGRKS